MSKPGEIYLRQRDSTNLSIVFIVFKSLNQLGPQLRVEGYIEVNGYLGTVFDLYTDIFL